MIKIITAIGNPRLNIELNKYNEFYTVSSDIQYKEGILEILENNNSVDLVIINSLLEGQISIEDLIEEINNINNKIKIIIIFEEKNKEMEDKLIKKGVYDFFYNDTELNHIINVLKNNNIEIINRELRKEIDELKVLINEKNSKNNKKKILEKLLKKEAKKCSNLRNLNENKNCKTLGVIGNGGVGKTSFIYFISNILSQKNKVLIVDFNVENNDFEIFYNLKKEYIEEDIFNIKNHIKIIGKNLFIISDLKQIIFDKKININFIINKINSIKNNYDFIFFDININEKYLENNYINNEISKDDFKDNNLIKNDNYKSENKQKSEENNTPITNIFKMCNSLLALTLTDTISLKRTDKMLKNITENNDQISKKIKIILYKNNIVNCLITKKRFLKNDLINYKIIAKIKYFFFYFFYIKNEKNINYNFFLKIKIKKIINKLLLN